MGPAQAAIVGSTLVGEVSEYLYLVLVGAIGTVSMAMSLITMYAINKARNGSIVVVQEIMQAVSFEMLLLFFIIALIAAGIGVLLTMSFARLFSKLMTHVNYRALCISIIIFVTGIIFFFTGWIGIAVAIVATCIGMLPDLLGIGKNHAMGSLLLPVILYLLL